MANPRTSYDTGEPASDMKNELHDQFDRVSDKVTETAKDVANQASKLVNRAAEVGGNMQEVAGNVQSAVSKSVKEQPMATVAIAAVLGFVLGAIWKS